MYRARLDLLTVAETMRGHLSTVHQSLTGRPVWKWFGATGRPRTPTLRPSTISRTIRCPISTGRTPRAGHDRPCLRPCDRDDAQPIVGPHPESNPLQQFDSRPGGVSTDSDQQRYDRGTFTAVCGHARVAELADAQASGACVRKDVGVQVPPRALRS